MQHQALVMRELALATGIWPRVLHLSVACTSGDVRFISKNTKLNGTNLMPFFVSHDNSDQPMNGRMKQFRYEIRANSRTFECLAGSCWMWDNDFIRAVGLQRRVFHRMEIELKLIGEERHHVYIVHHSTTLHVRQQPTHE